MYVCLCNKVTDRQIIRAHKKGARSIDCLKEELQVATTCGSCIEHAQMILDECQQLQEAMKKSELNYDLATQVA